MDDEEFKTAVLNSLEKLEMKVGELESDASANMEHMDKRLDAIVARLDEQDAGYDRLNDKVDRLSVAVRNSLEASEQALSAVTNIGRRVTRLEHPDE